MAWKAYNTINGQIMGEVPDMPGVAATDYLTDALGSVVATVSGGEILNTYRWSGYGQQVLKTGIGPDPKFLWIGGWGYRAGYVSYVRNRHVSPQIAVWTSKDALWPQESAYAYVSGSAATLIDPLGLGPGCICDPPGLTGVPKSHPLYNCFLDVCLWYSLVCKPAIRESDCSGWASCNALNKIYRSCKPTDACYKKCNRPGGNPTPGGGQPLPDWCCVECQIRICCHVECPLEESLDYIIKKRFDRCRSKRRRKPM